MARYRIAPLAQSDMDEIWFHVARNSLSAADRLLESFFDRFQILAAHPELGETRPEILPDIRSFAAGNYVIYYRIVSSGIAIARVLHGARDLKGLF